MISKIKLFLSIGVLIVILSLVIYHFITISKLKSEILNLKEDNHKLSISNFALNSNINSLEFALKTQNEKLDKISKDTEKKLEEYNKWSLLEDSVKYKNLKPVLEIEEDPNTDQCSILTQKLETIRKLKFKDL